MKIIKGSRMVPICDVQVGECFQSHEIIYMRIKLESSACNAIRLSDGMVSFFESTTVVRPIDVTLIVNNE